MSERKAYLNGKIFTSDPEAFHADAMIVEDGRIQWVGREEDIPSVADCTKVDLGGRRVLPGFVDAHMPCNACGFQYTDFRTAAGGEFDCRTDSGCC